MPLKGYPMCQKVMPKGPDQASIYDELGVRMCWLLIKLSSFQSFSDPNWTNLGKCRVEQCTPSLPELAWSQPTRRQHCLRLPVLFTACIRWSVIGDLAFVRRPVPIESGAFCQAFDHWCLAMFSFWYTWLYGGVTFVFFLSFPLSLPFWLDFEILSMCLLFCFVICWW